MNTNNTVVKAKTTQQLCEEVIKHMATLMPQSKFARGEVKAIPFPIELDQPGLDTYVGLVDNEVRIFFETPEQVPLALLSLAVVDREAAINTRTKRPTRFTVASQLQDLSVALSKQYQGKPEEIEIFSVFEELRHNFTTGPMDPKCTILKTVRTDTTFSMTVGALPSFLSVRQEEIDAKFGPGKSFEMTNTFYIPQ